MEVKSQEQILDDCMREIDKHIIYNGIPRPLIRAYIDKALTEARYAGQIEGVERLSEAVGK